MTIIEEGARYRVESDSGAVYEITYAGSGDADPDYVGLYKCNCPAGQRGKTCKHITAFVETRLMDVGDPYYEEDDLPREVVL